MMNEKKLKFNQPQLRFIVNLLRTNSATSIWSRGTGKSFLIGWLIKTIVHLLPRSVWAINGQSYKQILTRTLPSTRGALEYIGFVEGRDYVIGYRPPNNWRWQRPLEPPSDYTHFMTFRNGTGFHMISQDGGGSSARGLNIDGIICDESLLIDKERFDQQLVPANRGHRRLFRDLPIHHGIFHFSSMPYGNDSRWLLDHGKYYHEKSINIGELKERLIEHEISFIKEKDIGHRLEVWQKIVDIKKRLKYYVHDGMFYSEADVFDNIHNLGIKYIEQQYKALNILNFMVEILNWYPDRVDHGFYPEFSKTKHCYRPVYNESYLKSVELKDGGNLVLDSRADADCITSEPLRIAVDWGAKINSMTIAQYFRSTQTLRIIKDMYVKHPLILTDLAAKFCDYYRHHKNKNIIFLYDHTGNSRQANSKLTYAEQFSQILRKNGWNVKIESSGAACSHADKYLLINKIFKGKSDSIIEFNAENCKSTILSLSNAKLKESSKGIEKDKSSERNPYIPQEEATHLSDTIDLHILSLFSHDLYQNTFSADIAY